LNTEYECDAYRSIGAGQIRRKEINDESSPENGIAYRSGTRHIGGIIILRFTGGLGMHFKLKLRNFLDHGSLSNFLSQNKFRRAGIRVLDIGCGNNSVVRIKKILPKCHYTGIDIGDHNQTSHDIMDAYIIAKPDDFCTTIADQKADIIISTHNYEHVFTPNLYIESLAKACNPGASIYFSCPSEDSEYFPSRSHGILNFFDDSTHLGTPPRHESLVSEFTHNNLHILKSYAVYRPLFFYMQGLFWELLKKTNDVSYATWCYYGFEQIIWAQTDD
jgi:2-polyprenyl-3-methyl-5-hydroxy-6-metoxy-1,4-benzoquinol methylase